MAGKSQDGEMITYGAIADGINIFFFSEKGITVAGTYIKKEGCECGKCTILLLENGTKDICKEWDLIGSLVFDSDVFVFDVHGVRERWKAGP
jgi:hypothetical protein